MSITKFKKEIEQQFYACDLCGERIIQDGQNVVLVKHPRFKAKDYHAHFHADCLLSRLGIDCKDLI